MSKSKKQRDKRKRRRASIQAADAATVLQFVACDVAIKAAEGEGGDKLPTFSMKAYTGGSMTPMGFGTPVVVDLAGMKVRAASIPVLLNHDPAQIVGHGSAKVDGTDVHAEGVISGGGPAAVEVSASGKNGFPWQSSLGAAVESMEEVAAGSTAKANGQTFKGPVLIARKTVLNEISFVALGADSATSATVAATAAKLPEEETDMAFKAWVEAQGFTFEDLTDGQRSTLQAAYDAQNAKPAKPEADDAIKAARDEADQLRAEITEERRSMAVARICAQYDDPKLEVDGVEVSIEAHAIAEKWDTTRTELEALRASRAKAPAIHSRSHDGDCTLEAMQGAMLLNANVALDSKIFAGREAVAMRLPEFLRRGVNDDTRQKIMEASHRFSDMALIDICGEAIRLDGRTVPSGRADRIKAAFSGSSLDSVFTQSVSASLLMAYMQSEDTTGSWTTSQDVPDFKTNERELVNTLGGLSKLPRGQEADHTDRSDVEETYKVKRYAGQLTIDEQDIIDDRLDVFATTPVQMGRAAARLRPDLVYYIVLANANLADSTALFDSGHSNVATSAALAEATLKAAIALIEKQQDNSVNLNLRATHLIVPSDLKHTALNLAESAQLLYGADNETAIGGQNTISSGEQIMVVSDARLANGVTDPDSGTTNTGSATTWYLASNMGHTIEVGYLRGSGRAPQVRSKVLDEGKWGINWDVKMDIGAKALDFRAMARSTA